MDRPSFQQLLDSLDRLSREQLRRLGRAALALAHGGRVARGDRTACYLDNYCSWRRAIKGT